MRPRKNAVFIILILLSIAILVTFSEIALNAAVEAVELCLYTLVPSLFPIMFLSSSLLNLLATTHIPILDRICRICKAPSGSENILLAGLLGGYPVGAKLIAESYMQGSIQKEDAQRLLGFCNNAGPAFIFGVIGHAFSSLQISLVLWGMHITSAVITGCIIPKMIHNKLAHPRGIKVTRRSLITHCVSTMGLICGWVILFRILIAFLFAVLPSYVPAEFIVLISGILELSNGCTLLNTIADPASRFLIANCLISLGGFCVALQTAGIAHTIGLHYYFPGKIIQTAISTIISVIMQAILFTACSCCPFINKASP